MRKASLIERSRREIRRALRAFHGATDRARREEAIARAHDVQVWSAAMADWLRRSGRPIHNRRMV